MNENYVICEGILTDYLQDQQQAISDTVFAPSRITRGRLLQSQTLVASAHAKDHIRSEFRSEVAAMRYSAQVKPISFLKAHAAQVLLDLADKREPLVITQNGEAKAVLQDVASFEQTQEALALLKLLALGNRDIEEGHSKPARSVIARLRSKTPKR